MQNITSNLPTNLVSVYSSKKIHNVKGILNKIILILKTLPQLTPSTKVVLQIEFVKIMKHIFVTMDIKEI